MLPARVRTRVVLVAAAVLSAATATVLADDVPKLAGNWTWSWKDKEGATHHHLLEVEGVGTKIAARERFDEQAPVRVEDLKLAGKKVRFAVVRDDRRAEYSGVVADDSATINGTVTVTVGGQASEFVWKATRDPAEKKPARD